MNIILFAQMAELLGAKELTIPNLTDTDNLIQYLKDKYEGFGNSAYIIAVGKEVIQENTKLYSNSIIALLPPYSGG